MSTDVSPQANFETPSLGRVFSSQSLQPRRQLVVGTWNVKGLTDIKMCSICMHMRLYRIDVICLQETWVPQAEYYYEGGFKVLYKPQACIATPNRERVTPHHPPTAETRECTFVRGQAGPLCGAASWFPHSVRPPAVRPRAQSSLLRVFALRLQLFTVEAESRSKGEELNVCIRFTNCIRFTY